MKDSGPKWEHIVKDAVEEALEGEDPSPGAFEGMMLLVLAKMMARQTDILEEMLIHKKVDFIRASLGAPEEV